MKHELLKELIELAEDGYKLHLINSCHNEFLKEDRKVINEAKEYLVSLDEKNLWKFCPFCKSEELHLFQLTHCKCKSCKAQWTN